MDSETKQRLERLKKENKVKVAKEQLINVLNRFYNIDISSLTFVEYKLSECVHSLVYNRIKEDNIKTEKFHFEYDLANEKLKWLFNIFQPFENDKVLIFPSSFGFYFRNPNCLYLDFPIAVISTIKEFRNYIIKLVNDIHDDLIVVEENLEYGFVISENEYQDVIIEYWGI